MDKVLRILVTGSKGFLGKNLLSRLRERQDVFVLEFGRDDGLDALPALVAQADAVVHLAGENRPSDEQAFDRVNANLTETLCAAVRASGRHVPLILASSTQAMLDLPYGRSKLAAEQAVTRLADATSNPALIYRLPGVFGKWCRPNYNSVVATFCHNIARGLPIDIRDPAATVSLVYVDDVMDAFLHALDVMCPGGCTGLQWGEVAPRYAITLGELSAQIHAFEACRTSLMSEPVGTGLVRALYATYVSHLPVEKFSYPLPRHGDERGVFVEMLKTRDSGQFSYFTAHPGITRGSHYHHSKTEKFLVVKGEARFRFRHLVTDETQELFTSGASPCVVDSIPGWVHDITNVGTQEMVVMLWANENFDRGRPDTVACKV